MYPRLCVLLVLLAFPTLVAAQAPMGLLGVPMSPDGAPAAASPSSHPIATAASGLAAGAGIGLARYLAVQAGGAGLRAFGIAGLGALVDSYIQLRTTGKVDATRVAMHLIIAAVIASAPLTLPAALAAGLIGGVVADVLATSVENLGARHS